MIPTPTARPALLAATLLAAAPLAAQPSEAPPLSLDVVLAAEAGGAVPSDRAWSPDGRRLAYRWDEGDGEAIFLLDLEAAEAEAVLRLDELELPDAAGDTGRATLESWSWSPTGEALLLETDRGMALAPLDGGPPRRLAGGEIRDPRFSPDGAHLAFVRDGDLWLLDPATGDERALTTDGGEQAILNGVTDWVYWEEIWGRTSRGFWWSPDSRRIAFYRFDDSAVDRYPLVDFSPTYPAVEWQRYPKAGTANPTVRVGVVEVADGAIRWLATGDDPDVYLARVDWLPGSRRVAVQRLARDQDRLDLLRCPVDGGACEPLHGEHWPTWINLTLDLAFLADGRFLWSSERSGWRRLYLHGAGGEELRAITPEGLHLTSLDRVDEDAGELLYTAFETAGPGALHRRVYRQPLAGGPPRALTAAGHWSSAEPAPAGGRWIHLASDAESPVAAVVRDAAGALVHELPRRAPAGYDPASLPRWRFLTLPGADGEPLPAALLEPRRTAGGSRHPVIMYHYGGPGSQVVSDRWSARGRGLWHRMMAQRGFGVLMVDNPGSTHFGKRGEDRLHRRFGEVNLAAQLAGVAFLRGLEWVDPDRIGLWGWSGGGANTLYCVLNRPGVWRAAVAGAPVTDWRLYDTIWTERYLDHPDDNPEGYADSSAVTYAEHLADPLLVVHGLADDNVHPQNSLVLAERLIAAGRPFEQAVHPRPKHGFRGADERHFYERMTAFFERELGAPRAATGDPTD